MGKILIWAGLVLVAAGLVYHLFPGVLSWFGRLPGDIRIEKASGSVYIPITSMIVVSVALTILVNLFIRK